MVCGGELELGAERLKQQLPEIAGENDIMI
jgi:hypothetical protein